LGRKWRVVLGVAATALMGVVPSSAAADHRDDGPDIDRAPYVAPGTPQVGQRLDARGADWDGGWGIVVEWYWLRCNSSSTWACGFVDGARSSSYTVTQGDLGKRMRVALVVRRHDRDYEDCLRGRDGCEIAVSEPTAAVAAVPAPPPPTPPAPTPPLPLPPTPAPLAPTAPAAPAAPAAPSAPSTPAARALRMMRPAPLVRIRGWLTGSGAMISHLSVRAPRGARISVRCHGRGCPRKSLARMTTLTRLGAFERRLRAGTRLVIRVTRAGFIGKHTVIRIRRGKAPARRDLCLYRGSKGPAKCPAG
jgi:hypothetical protein